jgi:hypothetical protein
MRAVGRNDARKHDKTIDLMRMLAWQEVIRGSRRQSTDRNFGTDTPQDLVRFEEPTG